jgi:two-component system sensor histidine kinase PilS (NtrC family)
MSERDIHRHLLLMMSLRVAVSITLLVAAFAIELIYRPHLSLYPLFVITASICVLTVIYALTYPWLRDRRGYVTAQLLGDLALVTAFVYVSGGDESSFTFLYVVAVVVGAIFLERRGAMGVAALAWMLYAGMVVLMLYGWLPGQPPRQAQYNDLDRQRIYYSLAVHLVGFSCAALAVSFLAERQRLARRELEHKRSELAALQTLHSNILRSIASGILATDREGRIRFINPPALEILGRTGEELRGRTLEEALGEEEGFVERLRAQLEGRRRLRYERYYNNALGQRLFLGFSVAPIDSSERLTQGLLLVFQDLSERRALEEEVKLKDRMAVLGEMAAGLAHELRNPLASMTGSVQVLRQDLQLSGEQAGLMDIILRESQRLNQTIHEFLQFARPGRFQPRRTDLCALARDTLALLRNSPEFRPAHALECECEPGAGECFADPNLMKQLLWNLSTNALKAMPQGGKLAIRVENAAAGRRRLLVRDQGTGMPPQDVERFFRPFQGAFRGGTGLGLAIVYRIVEEHGGSLRVRSEPGRGTEIDIDLPAEAPAAEAPRAALAPAAL